MRAIKQGLTQMRTIRAKRIDILAKVRENRERHIAEYNQAVEDYKKELAILLQQEADKLLAQKTLVESGKFFKPEQPHIEIRMPESHEKDYDQVISMLEFETEEVIKVESDEFACYVMDDWDWKKSFDLVKMSYTNTLSSR